MVEVSPQFVASPSLSHLILNVLFHPISAFFLIPYSYAFALEENNERRRAEELARRALAMDPSASWGYHTLCEHSRLTR